MHTLTGRWPRDGTRSHFTLLSVAIREILSNWGRGLAGVGYFNQQLNVGARVFIIYLYKSFKKLQ